jgi:hypothetical protein
MDQELNAVNILSKEIAYAAVHGTTFGKGELRGQYPNNLR